MKDLNKENLKNALGNLPEYEPKVGLWDKIDAQMNISADNRVLSRALGELPEHSPSDKVWDNIESVLEADSRVANNNLKARWRRILSAAAGVVLLVGSFYYITSTHLDSGETIEYAEEIVDDNLLERAWNEEDDAFNKILAICETENFACTQPVFQSLKAELEELNTARDMLQIAIGEYGTDIELLQELKEIEMLRTSLLKDLASQIV